MEENQAAPVAAENQPVYQPSQAPIAATPEPSPKRPPVKTALMALVPLLLVGATVFTYVKFASASPEQNLLRMVESMSNATTVEYEGSVVMDMPGLDALPIGQTMDASGGEKAEPLRLTISGASDMTDPDNAKSSTKLRAEHKEFNGAFALEGKSIGDTLYFAISELPSDMPFGMESIRNKWVRIDRQEMLDKYGSKLSSEEKAELSKSFADAKLTPEETDKLWDAVKKSKALKVTRTLPSEEIEGADTYHYAYEIDKKEFVALIKEMMSIVAPDACVDGTECETLTDEDLDFFSSITGEIWLYKDSKNLARLQATILTKEESFSDDAGARKTSKTELTLTFKNYGKPVDIAAPTKSKSLDELLREMLGGMMGGFDESVPPMTSAGGETTYGNPTPAIRSADASIKSSLAVTRAIAELYWDNQPPNGYGVPYAAGVCPSAGVSMFAIDEQMSDAIADAAAASSGGLENTRCASDGLNYAISVRLRSDPAKAWCIDSSGNAKAISNLNWKGVGCP